MKSVGTNVDVWEKCTKKFLLRWTKHYTNQEVLRGAFAGCTLGECNGVVFCKKLKQPEEILYFYNGNERACDGDSGNTYTTKTVINLCMS